jgi:asparagine synthase (glutamine-hydrolysing)
MSGIFGFALSKRINGPEKVLDMMSDALPTHGSTKKSQWVGSDGQVGLGVIHPERISIASHSAEDQAQGVYCICEGTIHPKSDLDGEKSKNSKGAELLLKEYLKFDEECIENYSGSFNVAWWDEQRRRLVIANDKIGQRLLFYSQKNGTFVFGSYIARVVASDLFSREIDLEGFMDLINYSYILGERTLFKDLRILPPGSILIFENRRLTIKPYFDLQQIDPYGEYDKRRQEELSALFKNAVKRCIRSDITTAIDLTGGLDSRCILAAAAHMQLPFIAHTGGSINSTDVVLAKEAAAITGTEHFFEPINPGGMANWLVPMVQYQSGIVSTLHSHPCQHFELDMPFDAIVQGIGISYIRGQWVTPSNLSVKNPSHIKNLLKNRLYSKTAKIIDIKELWRPEFKKFIDEKSKEHFNDLFNQYASADKAIDVLDHIALVRCRKWLNKAILIVRGVREAAFPYLDDELMTAVAQLPIQERVKNRIQVDMIKQFYPKLLDVPLSKTLVPLSASPSKIWVIHQYRRLMKKLSKWPGINNTIPVKVPNHDVRKWSREQMRSTLLDILYNPDAIFRRYLDWTIVKPLLDQHFHGKMDWESLIASLIVFEIANGLWLDS